MPVSAGNGPKAAVLNSGIFEREPQTSHLDWLGIEKGAVLMTRNFAANVWLLEDVHRLEQVCVCQSERAGDFFYFWTARELVEYRIEVVQRVTDLIDRLFFRVFQRT